MLKAWHHTATLAIAMAAGTLAGVAQQPAFKLPYTQPFSLDTTLKVTLFFGAGGSNPFVVDTGSVGIVVPRVELPKTVTQAVAGSIRYTSSGLVVSGFWTNPIDVTLGASGAIAHVPVFAATDSHCVQPATNACVPGSLPHMMGIGFGRPDTYASPDRNPLIHIRNLPAGRSSNYRITHTGIELGILHAASIPGMHLIHLTSWSRPGQQNQSVTDFQTPAVTISVNRTAPLKATALIDTGITDALIALSAHEPPACMPLPPQQGANCSVASGTQFAIAMLDGAATLSFRFGDNGAATPASGHWIHLNPQEGSFINTGIRPLADFNVFYDYTNGLFGLDPVNGPAHQR